MRRLVRVPVIVLSVLSMMLLALPAAADHADRPSTRNLVARGHSANPASFFHPDIAPPEVNTDLAFWGDYAFHGNYDGFRVIDISDPDNPEELAHPRCAGNQGDVVVYENVLVRSWNSPAPEGATCAGQPVPLNWEGVHIFDISDVANPQLVGSVRTACGSHTATGVPDPDNNRLVIYSQSSGGPCYFQDLIEVPLDAPADARLVRHTPMEGEHACHDASVILGDVNMMLCASGHMTNVFDIGDNEWEGGSIDRPRFLYGIEEEGVGPMTPGEHTGSWHSGTFTWDGKVIVLGWEPGGGAQAECEEDDPDVQKSAFFYDAKTGEKLGQWTLPRAQTAEENCTVHNFNVIPTNDQYLLVSGNYQAGTYVTRFTNPARPKMLAYSDPEPLVPTDLGGAWSSYWYNGFIYESSITDGLNIFDYQPQNRRIRRAVEGAVELDHLNPQTQMFSLP